MTLTADQFTTPVERALESAVSSRISAITPPMPWDQDAIAEDVLEYLAETLSADAWTAALASLAYRRQVVLDAVYLHRYRGTRAALDRFADRAGVIVSYTLNRDAQDTRNASVDVEITPTVFTISSAEWVEYISRMIEGLLPIGITLNSVAVTPVTSGQSYLGFVARVQQVVRLRAVA